MNRELVKKIAVAVGTLIFCGALLIMYFLAIVPSKSPGKKNVTIEIAYSDKEFAYSNIITEKETVFELLDEWNEELSLGMKYSDGGFGPFIEELKGTRQNEAEGFYYRFKIGGETSNVGVSAAAIKDGDVVRFEYGYTTYGENYAFLRFDLKPSDAGAPAGTTRTYRSSGQIAIIVVCTVVAALGIGVVLFAAGRKEKRVDDYCDY